MGNRNSSTKDEQAEDDQYKDDTYATEKDARQKIKYKSMTQILAKRFWAIDNGIFLNFKGKEMILYTCRISRNLYLSFCTEKWENKQSIILPENGAYSNNNFWFYPRRLFQTKLVYSEEHGLLFVGIRDKDGIIDLSCYRIKSNGFKKAMTYGIIDNEPNINDFDIIQKESLLVIPNLNKLELINIFSKKKKEIFSVNSPISWVKVNEEKKSILTVGKQIKLFKYERSGSNEFKLYEMSAVSFFDNTSSILLGNWNEYFAVAMQNAFEGRDISYFKIKEDYTVEKIGQLDKVSPYFKDIATLPKQNTVIFYWNRVSKYASIETKIDQISQAAGMSVDLYGHPFIIFSNKDYSKLIVTYNTGGFWELIL